MTIKSAGVAFLGLFALSYSMGIKAQDKSFTLHDSI